MFQNKIFIGMIATGIIVGLIIYLIPAVNPPSREPNQVSESSEPTPIPTPTLTLQKQVIRQPQGKFEIHYTEYNQLYIITILDTPFETIRKQAEQALIGQLNISQKDACSKLKVTISAPYFVDPSAKPQTRFSFCTLPTPTRLPTR